MDIIRVDFFVPSFHIKSLNESPGVNPPGPITLQPKNIILMM